MQRKEFLRTCSMACISFGALGIFLPGCSGSRMINATIEGDGLKIPVSAFLKSDGVKSYKFLILQNEMLEYPICVFKIEPNNYNALLMKCSHQGAELQAFGDRLQCPAHGSEFDKMGKPLGPPADTALRNFQVTQQSNNLFILLQ